MRRIFQIIALLLFAAPAAAREGMVSLPLERYEALLEAGEAARWSPESAAYAIDATSAPAVVSAVLEGVLGPGGALEVPLPGGQVVYRKLLLDGQEAASVARPGGRYGVLIGVPGRHRVELELLAPVTQRRGERSLALSVPPVPLASAGLRLPAGSGEPRSQDALAISTNGTFALLATGSLAFSWASAAPKGPGPLALVQADALFSLAEDAVRCRFVVTPGARSAGLGLLEISLPPDAQVRSVSDVESGRTMTHRVMTEESGSKLVVQPLDGPRPARSCSVELSSPSPAGRVRLEVPAVLGAATQRGIVAWQKAPSIRVSSAHATGLTTVDASESTESLHAAPADEVEGLFRYSGLPARLELDAAPGEIRSAGTAAARELAARTFIGLDGRIVTWLRYRVRNERAKLLELDLPAGSVVLAAFEDGQPLQVGRKGDRAAVALRGSEPDRIVELELVLVQTRPPLGLWSSVALELPTAAMDVHRVDWDVSAPGDHELRFSNGSLQPRGNPGGPEPGDPGLAPAQAAPVTRRVANFERAGVTRSESLALQAQVLSGSFVRGMELLLFLLALLGPLAALWKGASMQALPLSAVPAAFATLLLGAFLPSPWRPLLSGLSMAAALLLVRLVAFEPER